MLKIRREWRRTSSSQAEPSPWRHCWTSWASCSNVSSASNPGTVTCATTLGQFLVNRGQPSRPAILWNEKCPQNVPPGTPPVTETMPASYSQVGTNTTSVPQRRSVSDYPCELNRSGATPSSQLIPQHFPVEKRPLSGCNLN